MRMIKRLHRATTYNINGKKKPKKKTQPIFVNSLKTWNMKET